MRTSIFISLLFTLLLVSCPANSSTQTTTNFLAQITDFGEFDRFPMEVSGYHRGQVTAYAPDMSDFSIAYNSGSPLFQNGVTLYFYPRFGDAATQLANEKAEILQAHPNARVVSEQMLKIQQPSGAFDATVTTFEYMGNFAGHIQNVSSQLILVLLPTTSFKVRSTTPVEQGVLAESALRKLLDKVKWAP